MRALITTACLLLSSCTATISSAERDKVETYAHRCSVAVMALVIERDAEAHTFITPDASCTGAFLGDYAMPAADFLKSTNITASAPDTYTVTLVSVTDHTYMMTVVDGMETFKAN